MVTYLLSPNRCHYNMNVIKVWDSDFKYAFPEIFNFIVGILLSFVSVLLLGYALEPKKTGKINTLFMDEIASKASMPLPNCFNATREIPGVEMPRVTGKMRRSNAKQMMLFDLETDPYETNDITEENPEIVNLLLEKLADYYVSQIFRDRTI